MLKVALLVATLGVAASAMATDNTLDAGKTVGAAACHVASASDPACVRAGDVNGDGVLSPSEIATLATASAPSGDWAASQAPHGAGLDFKDAALNPGLAPPPESSTTRKVIPALLALGALVVLLRKRPR